MKALIACACIAVIASTILLFVRDYERRAAQKAALELNEAAARARAADAALVADCAVLTRWNHTDSQHYALYLKCRDAGHARDLD